MRVVRGFFAFGLASLILIFVVAPPIPQPQAYHAFADQRALIVGVPNTLNVVSNFGFLIAAIFGLIAIRGARFVNRFERLDAIAFFAGTLLTAAGSTLY